MVETGEKVGRARGVVSTLDGTTQQGDTHDGAPVEGVGCWKCVGMDGGPALDVCAFVGLVVSGGGGELGPLTFVDVVNVVLVSVVVDVIEAMGQDEMVGQDSG